MPNNPKSIEEKMIKMLNAWKTLTPNKTYGGLTLEQFEVFVNDSLGARVSVAALDDTKMQAIAVREACDNVFLAKSELVVAGVLADPTEGADSAIYEAFGYVRKSARKSGLTRKAKAPKKALVSSGK